MDVEISTSDPDNVPPARVAAALQAANFFVLTVTVNEDIDGAWVYDPESDEEHEYTDYDSPTMLRDHLMEQHGYIPESANFVLYEQGLPGLEHMHRNLHDEDEDHPEHDECWDGCGLAVTHDGACRDKPGGRIICEHTEESS